jgi:hypothetical protein
MNDIEQKALALAIEARVDDRYRLCPDPTLTFGLWEALCRAIEQHEAFRQTVSDAILRYLAPTHVPHGLKGFIIPKPKPDALAKTLGEFDGTLWEPEDVLRFRAALDARGLEIREKGQ